MRRTLASLSMLLLASSISAEPSGMAAQLIKQLHMEKIPAEGAWFAATYRSEDSLSAGALPQRYGGVDVHSRVEVLHGHGR